MSRTEGPEGPEAPGQGPWLHLRHRYRKPWFGSVTLPERPLDRYEWRTAGGPGPGGPEDPGSGPGSGPGTGPGRRVPPFLRFLSEPGPQGRRSTTRRGPSIHSLVSSLSRRISRVLRDGPEPEPGESGRRDTSVCCVFWFQGPTRRVTGCHLWGSGSGSDVDLGWAEVRFWVKEVQVNSSGSWMMELHLQRSSSQSQRSSLNVNISCLFLSLVELDQIHSDPL